MKRQTHEVEPLQEKVRVKEYAVGKFIGVSTRSAIKKAIKKGCLFIDEHQATTASYVKGGEKLTLTIPETETPSRLKLSLEVVYEDDYLAIVVKPAGILVSGNKFMTVAAALPQNLQASQQEGAATPHPVHRLDYATTGLLLIGKTYSSIRKLMEMFEEKKIQKKYLAITIGQMKCSGVIDSPIDEKPSVSKFNVLQSVPSPRFGYLNLVELEPHTGRRHQLRKHLFSIGHPILGDKDYYLEGLQLNGKGMYLHACELEFIHPISKELLHISHRTIKKFEKIFDPNRQQNA